MKRFLFIGILFALCLHFNQAHAQRYLPGMKGLQVTAGMTDGVHWNAGSDFAYHIGAAYSVYTKNANRWVIGGEYLHKKYDYKDMQIPVEQFTAEGGYYLKFLSDRRKTFSCRWDCRHSPGMKRATEAKSSCRTALRCWIRTASFTAVR